MATLSSFLARYPLLPPLAVLLAAFLTAGGLYGWLAVNAEDTLSRRHLKIPQAVTPLQQGLTPEEQALLQQEKPGKTPPAAARPETPAPPAPVKATVDNSLIEASTFGSLPRINNKGDTPWQTYAASSPSADRKRLAIILHNAGLNTPLLERAREQLPPPMTFAFTPYARNIDLHIADIRKAGHEALLLLPMEGRDYPASDPGNRALMLANDDTQNNDRLLWSLGRGMGYTGVMPLFGDAFTETPWRIDPVLQAVTARGLLFVDSTSRKGQAVTSGRATIHGLPWLAVSGNALAQRDRNGLEHALEDAARSARSAGKTTLLLPLLPVTLEVLQKRLAGILKDDIALAPVSALAVVEKAP